jgi:competence protein ComGC
MPNIVEGEWDFQNLIFTLIAIILVISALILFIPTLTDGLKIIVCGQCGCNNEFGNNVKHFQTYENDTALYAQLCDGRIIKVNMVV